MADALTGGGTEEHPFGYEQRLEQKNERIEELEAQLDRKQATIRDLRDRLETATGHHTFDHYEKPPDGEDGTASDGTDRTDAGATASTGASESGGIDITGLTRAASGGADEATGAESAEDAPTVELLAGNAAGRGVDEELIDEHMERLRRKGERLQADTAPVPPGPDLDLDELLDLVHAEPVVAAIDTACSESLCNHEHAWSIVAALVAQAPMRLEELTECVPLDTEAVGSFLSELDTRSLVVRDTRRRYRLNPAEMRCLTDSVAAGERSADEFARQWDA